MLRAALHRTRVGRRLDSTLTLIAFGLLCGEIAALSPERTGMFPLCAGGVRRGGRDRLRPHALVLFVDFHLRESRGAGVSSIVRDVGSVLVYFFIISSSCGSR